MYIKSVVFLIILLLFPSITFAGDFFINLKNGFVVRDSTYFELDNGQKFNADYGHNWRVTISVGYKPEWCSVVNCKVGLSHESSLLSGAPFNEDYEYTNEQVFFEMEFVF